MNYYHNPTIRQRRQEQTTEILSAAYIDKTNYKEMTVAGRFVLTFCEGELLCTEN